MLYRRYYFPVVADYKSVATGINSYHLINVKKGEKL